jgi:TolA-binding protein
MSTLNPTSKISRRQELREDKVVTLYAWAIDLYENNRTLLMGIAGAVVLVIAGVIGYQIYMANQQTVALDRMAGAVQAYESGNYQVALDGSEIFLGLEAIIDDYGSTRAGNLARFYAADAYFRMGNYDAALPLFQAFDKDANLLGASALAGEAAILQSRGEARDAGDLFRRAANLFPSEVVSPGYLMQAGLAYEAAGETARARSAYEQIRDDYPDSQEARDIAFFLARTGG